MRLYTTQYLLYLSLILANNLSNASDSLPNEQNCIKYTVTQGESLIQILRKHSLYPIFGKEGSLNKTYKLNNKEETKRKELIYKGDLLCLPKVKQNTILSSNEKEKMITEDKKKIDEKSAEYKKIPPVAAQPKNDELIYESTKSKTNIDDEYAKLTCNKYVVKNGDTIIGILRSQSLYPVFGKTGSLSVALALNKREHKNGYLIYKNNIICLPIKTELQKLQLTAKNDKIKDGEIIEQDKDFTDKENIEINMISKEKSDLNNENNLKNFISKKPYENNETSKKTQKILTKRNYNNDVNNLQMQKNNSIAKNKLGFKNKIQATKCNIYKAEEGEKLIEILRKKSLLPIYGEEGSFKKTLEANPNIPVNNPEFHEGQTICLAEENINKSDVNKTKTPSRNNQMFYIEGGGRYLRLDDTDSSTGTSASLLSRMIVSMDAGLIQKWTPDLQTYIGINYAVSQIMESDTSVVIGGSIIRLTNFIFGAKYQFDPRIYGQMELGYGDELLFRAVTVNTIQVEKMSTAKLKTLAGYTLYTDGNFGFHGELGFLINTPFNNEIYRANLGTGFEAALAGSYQGEDWDFKARVYYTKHQTNIPPVLFTYYETGILMRLSVDLPQ
ncbi:hypothetical protein [Silvanigrella aquatica]|nr:hypothetical protein [Silvanigrella aquatica]